MKPLLTMLMLVAILAQPALAQDNSYCFVEMVPDGISLIGAGGVYQTGEQSLKADLWCFPESELGVTVGPVIGPVAIGIGASAADFNDHIEMTWLDADLFLLLHFSGIAWSSYNLAQYGRRAGTDDFLLSKNWLSLGNSRLGIVGHNTKTGAEKWRLHWGPLYDFGALGIMKSSRVYVAPDLNNLKQFRAAWIVNL